MTGRSRNWGGLIVSSIIEPEVVSALAKYVRTCTIPAQHKQALQEHPRTVQAFRKEFASGAFRIVPVNDQLLATATDLLRDHPNWEIGAADALHLATAISVRATMDRDVRVVFVTADRGLAKAAEVKGFRVFDPVYHGIEALTAIDGLKPAEGSDSR